MPTTATRNMKPAKRSKVEEKKVSSNDAKEKRMNELTQEIDQLVEEEDMRKAQIKMECCDASNKARKEMAKLAKKQIPAFWRECLCYNETLRCIISKEDEVVLNTVSEMDFTEDDETAMFTVSVKFDADNNEFTNKELKRSFGGMPTAVSETTGVNWKKGRSPDARNEAEGRAPTDPNCAYSFFELFEAGELDESEVIVLSELRKIIEDPISCYLGEDEEDESDIEALELGEE